MTCQVTVPEGQSEFAFFQQLKVNDNTALCCGPLTQIGFTRPSMKLMCDAILAMGLSENYLDNYDPIMLDSSHMSLTMCPKHWIMHSTAINNLAEQTNNDLLHQLSHFIFRFACLTNDWDFKEIVNYAVSVSGSKPDH